MVSVRFADSGGLEDKGAFEYALASVSEYRRQKVQRLKTEGEKRLSLTAGYLLESMLEEELGVSIGEGEFVEGENGKPSLLGSDVKFSLSHSKKCAMCVVSRDEKISAVGCDIERVNSDVKISIADRFFTPDEASYVHGGKNDEDVAYRFFRLWVLKESLMKATGCGFSLPMNKFEIRFDADDVPYVYYIDSKIGVPPKLFEFSEYPAPEGYLAATAIIKKDMPQ